jgi:hypothetical protein
MICFDGSALLIYAFLCFHFWASCDAYVVHQFDDISCVIGVGVLDFESDDT